MYGEAVSLCENHVMPNTAPPRLPTELLKFSAKIDFIKIKLPSAKSTLPRLDGTGLKSLLARGNPDEWKATIHDPSRGDIERMVDHLLDPSMVEFELAVDLKPKVDPSDPSWLTTMLTTYDALAGRFRPEDKALWGYGKRGSVEGKGLPVRPLEGGRPNTPQEIIYGSRYSFAQARMYWKTLDQDRILDEKDQVIRMEVNLKNFMHESLIPMPTLSHLIGYAYRASFTQHFRIIDRPEVRSLRGLRAAERSERFALMSRAWNKAGVAKFAIQPALPADTLDSDAKEILRRQRSQLPHSQYKLIRDQAANAKIGSALMNLERRLQRR